jgi:lambda family phage holin
MTNETDPTILSSVPPHYVGAVLSMFVAFVRVIYDKKETRPIRILMEAVLCGALSVTASYAINAAGLDMNWAVFAGGVIGYLGSEGVRSFAVRFIDARIKKA